MLRHSRLWTTFVILTVIILSVVFGWSRLTRSMSTFQETVGPRTLAIINGIAVTQEMVDRELKISRLNVSNPLPPLTGDDLARAREEALNQLLSRQLILQAAAQTGFVLEPAYISDRATLLFGPQDDQALTTALVEIKANQDDLLWWVGEIFTVEEFTTKMIMADTAPEDRQQVYNEWLNAQQSAAKIEIFSEGQTLGSQALIGQAAPEFALTTVDGQTMSLSDHTGQIVLINFWATWCPSCVTEMPDYEQIYQQYQPEFVVLGVNLQENSSHVQQYADGLGLTFPVLLDGDGSVTTHQYQVTGMPGSILVDRQGRIFYRHIGPMSAETLTAKLAELGL